MKKPLSEKILELRRAKGLTQEKLGELCGVSGQAISKWENGDSLPDILLLPRLCEVLGSTADALLEVPSTVAQQSCMAGVFSYAKEVGECRAAYEAVCATSYLAEQSNGAAKMSSDGIKIHTANGLALVVSGSDAMQKLLEIDAAALGSLCALVQDMGVLSVMRVMHYGIYLTQAEIDAAAELTPEESTRALARLLRYGICEYDLSRGYVLGQKSYALFACLAGMSLASSDDIGTTCCRYIPS